MDSEKNFETYLVIDQDEFIISTIDNTTYEIVYTEKVLIDCTKEDLNFEKLNEFIEHNIFKIEKNLKNFVKNIYIILNSKVFKLNYPLKK